MGNSFGLKRPRCKTCHGRKCSVMHERMRFVIRLKDGERSDRARRPFRYANQLPEPVEAAIVAARREKPTWGARKIRERLLRRLPHAVQVPACSTIHAVLDRHGLVSRPQ